jgi:hypothetical protein
MKLRKKARKLARRIPILRALQKRVHEDAAKSKPGRRPFPGSAAYWEQRYAGGGDSGVGSYTKFAGFKAEVLNAFVASNNIDTVIELGCGDGNQLSLANYPRYLGFDVSTTAVDLCLSKFADDKSKSFKLLHQYAGETADLTISLDVLFHLIEDDRFEEHMRLLFNSAARFVIIYSSDTDVNDHRDSHVKHRNFTKWIQANVSGWSLDRRIANRYPYAGDYKKGSFADFYIYRKIGG